MSRRNSIQVTAAKITTEIVQTASPRLEMTVTIAAPNNKTLLKLIADASRLLEWRQRHEPEDM